MVYTANDLLGWKDFPKGLRVLVLEEDNTSAAEIRSKLEEMDYIVSTFYREDEALSAISDNSKGFHVAIVEVSEANSDGRFKFLETAKDLPTIMISDVNCLSTMMKCIALGAVEFLTKPLSEDKLKNIWQHVVHKAFSAGGKDLSESLKPIKESLGSILQLQLVKQEPKKELTVETARDTLVQETVELSAGSDKYPAPSTPQIKQGVRLLDDGDCQDQANFLTEKESSEQDSESKSVETTCDILVAETAVETGQPQRLEEETVVKQEDESAGGVSKSENKVSSHPSSNKGCSTDFVGDSKNPNKASGPTNSRGTKANRRKVKVKVDWTPELHKKFVQAVEQLGVDQAIPSRILEMMNMEGLTRHNVASHLQKYRIQRRHILPKANERRWPNPNSMQRNYYNPHKPVMAYPPYHSNQALSGSQVYPGWVPTANYPTHLWSPPYYPSWQSGESWQYNFPVMHADAWGCPMMPPPVGPCPSFPQAEEVLDKVVKEVISKPWLPLPLGLKAPSTESVLTELTKQGIATIPPCIKDTRPN